MKSAVSKKDEQLQNEQILKALEEVAERLCVRVHFEEMKAFEFRVMDGLCRVRGEPHIFIDRKRGLTEKIQVLAQELRKFDLEQIYLAPLLRERIFPDEGGFSIATESNTPAPLAPEPV